MAKLCVMKTGETTFEAESRVESTTGAPLTVEGVEQVRTAAKELATQDIDVIYSAPGESEKQTAQLVAEALRIKVRTEAELHELDYGLWQGLTLAEIKRRQPKVYRQWTEAPTTVRPPGGEMLTEAQRRIRKAVHSILKRHTKNGPPLLVLRPVALGLLQCILEQSGPERIWQHSDPSFTWSSYEMPENSL